MSEADKPTEAAPAQTDSILPLATATAAGVAAVVALISLVLLLLVARDIASLQTQVRKLNHAVKAVEEEMGKLKLPAPPAPAAERPPPPQPTHIDAGDAATDCIVRPGSKNPLADCLK